MGAYMDAVKHLTSNHVKYIDAPPVASNHEAFGVGAEIDRVDSTIR